MKLLSDPVGKMQSPLLISVEEKVRSGTSRLFYLYKSEHATPSVR